MALLFECMGKCCRNMLDTADLFSTTPVVQSATLIGGGHVATISANVNTNGILWVINGTNMQAYGAGTLKLLYTTKDAGTRDTLPTTAHFVTQTVANGKVYVATRQNLVVYGLFPALLTVAGNNPNSYCKHCASGGAENKGG